MEYLGIFLLLFLWGGASLLFYTDIKEQKVYLWNYVFYIGATVFYTLIKHPFKSLLVAFETNLVFKIVTILLFLVILMFYMRSHKIAVADVILIILVFLLFPVKIALYILIASSLFGVLVAYLTKSKNVGFVGILSLLVALALLVANFV